jgi:hypothetical protein
VNWEFEVGLNVRRIKLASRQSALVAGLHLLARCVTADAMAFHKFKIGQKVSFRPYRGASPRACTVIALLPEKGGEFEYQIRCPGARSDLVTGESKLRENREH